MSMETRLLIFFVLMGLVLLGTQYFYKPPPQPNKPAAVSPASTDAALPAPVSPDTATPSKATQPATAPAPPADLPGRVQADKEESFTVETNLYRVTFSNRGAVVSSWILKAYKDHAGKALDLINPRSLGKVPAPFSLVMKTQPSTDPNAALFKVEQPDPLTLKFEFSDGRTVTKKSFQFVDNSYLVAVATEVSQNGILVPHSFAWRGGFGDQTVSTAATDEQVAYYDSKRQTKAAKDAKNGPVSFSGQFSFEGMEDKFFAGVFLPSSHSSSNEVTVFSDTLPNAAGADEQRLAWPWEAKASI